MATKLRGGSVTRAAWIREERADAGPTKGYVYVLYIQLHLFLETGFSRSGGCPAQRIARHLDDSKFCHAHPPALLAACTPFRTTCACCEVNLLLASSVQPRIGAPNGAPPGPCGRGKAGAPGAGGAESGVLRWMVGE